NGFEGTETEWLESLKGAGLADRIAALERTTGLRDITADITGSADYQSGRLLIRRNQDEITLILDDLVLGASGTSTFYRLPSGMRPLHARRDTWWRPSSSSQDTAGTVNISTSGYVVGYQLVPGEAM